MISVVIPAYNVEQYIQKACISALVQPEVGEVVVVDDGSTDRTFSLVEKMMVKEDKLKLFNHPGSQNLGRSVSRNLGIIKSTFSYIAFLDADDFYLPGRFKKDIDLFKQLPLADGIYNAVGFHSGELSGKNLPLNTQLTSIRGKIEPTELFFQMAPIGAKGIIHANGLTVKRSLFSVVGLFNENFEVAEDIEMWSRMALLGKLYPGNLSSPVAMRRVHDKNTFYLKEKYSFIKLKLYKSLLTWSYSNMLSPSVKYIVLKGVLQGSIGVICRKLRRKFKPNTTSLICLIPSIHQLLLSK